MQLTQSGLNSTKNVRQLITECVNLKLQRGCTFAIITFIQATFSVMPLANSVTWVTIQLQGELYKTKNYSYKYVKVLIFRWNDEGFILIRKWAMMEYHDDFF